MPEDPPDRTIISRSSVGPRRVSENVKNGEWESFPRREPKPARERLGPLKPPDAPKLGKG
jgi:hypothetical protein